jgi:hypothetical protein
MRLKKKDRFKIGDQAVMRETLAKKPFGRIIDLAA